MATPEENPTKETEESTTEEVPAVESEENSTEENPSEKKINILDLPGVVEGFLRSRKQFESLSPSDLKALYKLFLYTYIEKYHYDKAVAKAKKLTDKKKLPNRAFEIGDVSRICLTVADMLRILNIYYNGIYKQVFDSKGMQ